MSPLIVKIYLANDATKTSTESAKPGNFFMRFLVKTKFMVTTKLLEFLKKINRYETVGNASWQKRLALEQ